MWLYKAQSGKEVTEALMLLYDMSNNAPKYYQKKEIPKKQGGKRVLSVPVTELKRVLCCIKAEILDYIPVSDYARAYKKGGGIAHAAKEHVGHETLLRLDIEGFFDHITYKEVYKHVFGRYYPRKVAGLLTALCCYEKHLPQGAPTSPAISNIVMKGFDDEVAVFCKMNNIHYTRYCDDCIFSGKFDVGAVIKKVKSELLKMGLRLNDEKTKVISQGQRQIVLGVCVNEKMQAPAAYRNRIRQEIYYCKKYGVKNHLLRLNDERFVKKTPGGVFVDAVGYLMQLKGKISFVLSINPDDKEMREYFNLLSVSKKSTRAKKSC